MYEKGDTYDCTGGNLEEIAGILGSNEIPDSLKNYWKISQRTYDADRMYFLQDYFLIEVNDILKLSDDAISAFLQVLSLARNNTVLSRLIWHYYYILFVYKNDVTSEIDQLLSGEKSMRYPFSALGGMFPSIIMLAGLSEAIKLHCSLNIPHNITIDTFSDIRIWMEDYYCKHGFWGLSELSWLYSHLLGRLYRIGRIQYIHKQFSGNIRAFRNISNGEIMILSEPNLKYRKDGLLDGTNDIYDTEDVWISKLNIDDHYIYSNCMLINGYAQKKDITLPLAEWKQILSKEDYSLEMHIPTGGRLDNKECRESLTQAIRFYQTYFPDKKFVAFNCGSWLLEPQFQKILPPSSNIVQFQKLFHIYPILGNESPFLDRVFGYRCEDMPSDLSKLPQDTTLQRAVLHNLIAGNRMHPGAGVIFPDEVLSV